MKGSHAAESGNPLPAKRGFSRSSRNQTHPMKSVLAAKDNAPDRSYLDVLQLDLKVPLMVHVLLSQVHSMGITTCLAQHSDSCFHVKVHLPLARLHGREVAGELLAEDPDCNPPPPLFGSRHASFNRPGLITIKTCKPLLNKKSSKRFMKLSN